MKRIIYLICVIFSIIIFYKAYAWEGDGGSVDGTVISPSSVSIGMDTTSTAANDSSGLLIRGPVSHWGGVRGGYEFQHVINVPRYGVNGRGYGLKFNAIDGADFIMMQYAGAPGYVLASSGYTITTDAVFTITARQTIEMQNDGRTIFFNDDANYNTGISSAGFSGVPVHDLEVQGTLGYQSRTIHCTADTTILSSWAGDVITNLGASGHIDVTAASSDTGSLWTFVRANGDSLNVVAAAGDSIFVGGTPYSYVAVKAHGVTTTLRCLNDSRIQADSTQVEGITGL